MGSALLEATVFLGAAAIVAPLFRKLGFGAVLGYVAAGVLISAAALAAGVVSASDLRAVFKQVNRAVVTVHVSDRVAAAQAHEGGGLPGVGSGVIVSPDGLVVTAAHVVEYADRVTVAMYDGESVPARVVLSDPGADLALLRLLEVPAGLPVATLGDSDRTEIGEEIFVVGAPYGLSHSLTVGHVSARYLGDPLGGGELFAPVSEFFQTDAAINEGNSGGPMFDMQGQVIGIVSYILTTSGGYEGLGFGVASNAVRRNLLENRPAWSGATAFPLAGELAEAFNLPQAAGLLVQQVERGSPAARAGLRAGQLPAYVMDFEMLIGGDIVLAVDGIAAGTPDAREAIVAHLEKRKSGSEVAVRVLRAGRQLELRIELLRGRPSGPRD